MEKAINIFSNTLAIVLAVIWKIWFMIISVILICISVLSIPFLFSDKYYPIACRIHRAWGMLTVFLMGYRPRVEKGKKIDTAQTYIIVSNHRSLIDIMLIYSLISQPFLFIGKAELGRLPLFGYIYRKSSILVDRKDRGSRIKAFNKAKEKIDAGRSICIFPEGGIPKKNPLLGPFQQGAFALAIEKQIPILAFTMADTRARFSYALSKGGPGKIHIKQHDPISTKGLTSKDKDGLKEKCYQMMHAQLELFRKENKITT